MNTTVPPVIPARAERIAAACAKLVDLLSRHPAPLPATVATQARQSDRRPQPDDRAV